METRKQTLTQYSKRHVLLSSYIPQKPKNLIFVHLKNKNLPRNKFNCTLFQEHPRHALIFPKMMSKSLGPLLCSFNHVLLRIHLNSMTVRRIVFANSLMTNEILKVAAH